MRDIAEASLWLLNSHVLLLLNGVISDQYTLPAPLFCLQLLQINLEERKKEKVLKVDLFYTKAEIHFLVLKEVK